MKTVLVVFIQKGSVPDKKSTKFTFNTEDKIEVGDIFESSEYKGRLIQVVDILEDKYQYVNTITGELSNTCNSTKQVKIRTLRQVETDDFVMVKKFNV